MWVYANDQRPRADNAPVLAGYYYSPDRKGERLQEHLKNFIGILRADSYAGYDKLYISKDNLTPTIEEETCWAHTRRRFYDIVAYNDRANIVLAVIDKIAEIYHIESQIRVFDPDIRSKTRQEKLCKLGDELFTGYYISQIYVGGG